MFVTELGIVKLFNELQPAKADSSMFVTEFGIVKLFNELQPSKADSSMFVTEFGIVKLSNELQSCKALLQALSIDVGVAKAGPMLLETYLCRIGVQNRRDTFHMKQATSTAKLRSRRLWYLPFGIVEWHVQNHNQTRNPRRV